MKRLLQFLNTKQQYSCLVIMYVIFFIFTGFLLLFFLSFASQSGIVFSEDDGFFTIVPEDYYDLPGNEEESMVSDQLKETESSNQTSLQTITNKNSFNIAVTSDWGCAEDTRNTVQNIQKKNPELVIAGGDLSYEESSKCWFEIIQPLKSKTKIAMGDHEYTDTKGGVVGITNEYLKPFNLEKTYYSFDIKNVHFTILDPYIDYRNSSAQYRFIENDLKTTSNNPNIDWTFVVESIPIYTSLSQHPGNS
ncbi:MAG: metallophosphoesterase, partial [Nitrososphaeraceae archaeon]|nr:metallophosphoesterase [Nitrososphaeraceae archaeon]